MRLPLIALLLLSAASPALAEPQPELTQEPVSDQPEVRFEARARPERSVEIERLSPSTRHLERQERRLEREARSEPPPAMAEAWRSEEPVVPFEAPVAPRAARESDAFRAAARNRSDERREPSQANPSIDSVAGWRWREREGERRGRHREVPPAPASPVFGEAIQTPRTVTPPTGAPSIGSVAAAGVQADRLRDRRAAEAWRQDWRRDRRYDWRRHRDRDRSRFHLGIYIDPFGWGYRRWQVGRDLYPRFYQSRYWINDPWEYRLPQVGYPYRWVRYWNDALLVDVRSGRVLDVVYGVFW